VTLREKGEKYMGVEDIAMYKTFIKNIPLQTNMTQLQDTSIFKFCSGLRNVSLLY